MIRLAADAALFVLDDEGVFLSGVDQELHTFNTVATYIWCCLEEGMGPDEIVSAYADAFATSAGEAGESVWRALESWEALGYLSGVPGRPDRHADFTTALARLLTRPGLRAEHRADPGSLARRLGLQGEEREAFGAMDPIEVEAEAEAIDAWRRRLRGTEAEPSAGIALPSPTGTGRFLLEQALEAMAEGPAPEHHLHLHLLGTRFCLRCPPEACERVEAPLEHLRVTGPGEVDRPLTLLGAADRYVLLDGVMPVGTCRLDQLAPLVRGTLQALASQRREHFLQLHAAVIADAGSATLLPGPPGSGKTTLAASAARHGFLYLSEELALLDGETLSVWPMPLPLTVKAGSVRPLEREYPRITGLDVHLREDDREVRYLPPPEESLAYDTGQSWPVRRVVFPTYREGAETRLRPISRAETLRRLMRECLALQSGLDARSVRNLVAWARSLECFDLRFSDLPSALRALKQPD